MTKKSKKHASTQEDSATEEMEAQNESEVGEGPQREEGVGEFVDPYSDIRPGFAVRSDGDIKRLQKKLRQLRRLQKEHELAALEKAQARLTSRAGEARGRDPSPEPTEAEHQRQPSTAMIPLSTSAVISSTSAVLPPPPLTKTSAAKSGSTVGSLAETLSQGDMDANRETLFEKCSDNFKRHYHTRQQPFSAPFTGAKSQSLDEFLGRFNLWANRFRWTEQDKVFGLQMALDGSAAKTYDRLVANGSLLDLGLDGATQKLRAAFPASSLSQTQAIARFSQLFQGGEETVTDYSERFRDAMEQTTITEDSALALALWCESVREDIRPHLMRFIPDDDAPGPHPLSQAIAEAARVERNTKRATSTTSEWPGEKRRRVSFEDTDGEPATGRRTAVRALGIAPLPAEIGPEANAVNSFDFLSAALEPTLRQMRALCETQQVVAARMQESHMRAAAPPPPVFIPTNQLLPQMPVSQEQGPRCFQCNQMGHRRHNCPMNQQFQRGRDFNSSHTHHRGRGSRGQSGGRGSWNRTWVRNHGAGDGQSRDSRQERGPWEPQGGWDNGDQGQGRGSASERPPDQQRHRQWQGDSSVTPGGLSKPDRQMVARVAAIIRADREAGAVTRGSASTAPEHPN